MTPASVPDADRGSPIRVYMDQMNWVASVRALAGKADAVHLRDDVRRLIGLAIDRAISVPLSESHFYETWTRASQRQRPSLAELMILVSRRDAIAPLSAVWKWELDAFIDRRLLNTDPEPINPFGTGAMYAMFGSHDDRLPADASESDRALAELFVLAEPDRSKNGPEETAWLAGWDRWADRFTGLAAEYKKDAPKYDANDRAASAIFAILGNEVIGRAIGKDAVDPFLAYMGDKGSWAVAREMPAVGTLCELFRRRIPNAGRPWEPNDLHDLRFLAVALAYCDRVSCDKSWARLAHDSEFIRDRGAVIASGASSIADLTVGIGP